MSIDTVLEVAGSRRGPPQRLVEQAYKASCHEVIGLVLNSVTPQAVNGILDPIVPKGSRIGQEDVRASHGVSIVTQSFTQFDDSPDHLHVDVLWAKGGLQLPGSPAPTG